MASWRRGHVFAERSVMTQHAGPGGELRPTVGRTQLVFPTWMRTRPPSTTPRPRRSQFRTGQAEAQSSEEWVGSL